MGIARRKACPVGAEPCIGSDLSGPGYWKHVIRGALIWNQLQPAIEGDLDPNLVRAVLANSASVPEAASNRIAAINDDNAILRVCGYGLPDAELALESGDRRVTLIAQARIASSTKRMGSTASTT